MDDDEDPETPNADNNNLMHLMEQKIRDTFVVSDAWDPSMAN